MLSSSDAYTPSARCAKNTPADSPIRPHEKSPIKISSPSGKAVTLFRFKEKLQPVSHRTALSILTVSNKSSSRLFSTLTKFRVMELNPLTSLRGRLNNRSSLNFLYKSAAKEIRLLKKDRSKPALYCVVVSQPNSVFIIAS